MASTRSVEGRIHKHTSAVPSRRRLTGAIGARRIDLAVAGIVVLLLLLGFTRIDRYPAPWFDEGIHLQVAKNFAADGTYAAPSADGTLDYAPAIGVGPTLLLPVAAMLNIFGTSLEAGRAVPVLYLVVATALLFSIARGLFGRRAGFATLAILLTMPALDWVETGRQVLGEVPALAFLLLGGVLVYRSRSTPALVVSGVVLGLSLVTKGQYVLIVPATLLALALVDTRWSRHRSLGWHATLFATVLATWATWIAALLLIIGDGNVVENVSLLRESSSGALLVFDVGRMAAAWRVVLGPGTFCIVIPAIVAGLLAIRAANGDRRFAILALWLFQAAWLGWFLVASIGWPRYAFAGLAINAIFAGYLFDQLWMRARTFKTRQLQPAPVLSAAACLGMVLLLVLGSWRTLSPVGRADESDATRFAAVLRVAVPAGATVDAWEPELGFLTDVAIQPPPPGSLSEVVETRWFGGTMPDFSTELDGDYLVVGSFGRWTGVYRSAQADWQLIASVGEYELYQRPD